MRLSAGLARSLAERMAAVDAAVPRNRGPGTIRCGCPCVMQALGAESGPEHCQTQSDVDPNSLMPDACRGHGSPMNALERNGDDAAWSAFGADSPRPRAILAVSAHG